MNLSGIPKDSFLGKLLRYPLRFIPNQATVPILQGRLRGKRWIIGTGNHGYWLGSYEFRKRRLFERTITQGSTVYDLGGFVGYYTLLASMLVGPAGKVFVFEPLPRNLRYLREHLRLNATNNVTIVEAAVSDRDGTISFQEGQSNSRGHIAEQGTLQVEVIALDKLAESGQLLPPKYMKIDVEGAEKKVFLGARSLLENWHPTIFLDTHGPAVHMECCRFLRDMGYRLETIDGKNLEDSREIYAVYE